MKSIFYKYVIKVNQRIKGIEVDGDLSHHLQFADHDLRCLDGCCNDDLMEVHIFYYV